MNLYLKYNCMHFLQILKCRFQHSFLRCRGYEWSFNLEKQFVGRRGESDHQCDSGRLFLHSITFIGVTIADCSRRSAHWPLGATFVLSNSHTCPSHRWKETPYKRYNLCVVAHIFSMTLFITAWIFRLRSLKTVWDQQF